jgi:hypothetical protein
LTGGAGGQGGYAVTSGSKYVTSGKGGDGGDVEGGGIFILAGPGSINHVGTSAIPQNGILGINNVAIIGNTLTGGAGANGGAGSSSKGSTTPGPFALGGQGGDAFGGGIYNESLNPNAGGSFFLISSALAGNQVSGGAGGNGGVGTTSNGGPGGNGGNGGDGFGGGMYQGDAGGANNTLTVVNTTIGGPSAGNVLSGGLGGNGGDAGTPNLVPFNDGGNGGNGGNVEGGGIFVGGGSTNFINVTIASNLALASSLGGTSGAGAGTGGIAGQAGANGNGTGGGYFAAAGSSNSIGNTILDLNNAKDGPNGYGTFNSLGGNIVGSSSRAVGFNASLGDQVAVSAAQLKLGPFLNNGGLMPTDALLPGNQQANVPASAAIGAGNTALITFALFGPLPTDQRGVGFSRETNGAVDAGAFQFQPPSIISLSPSSVVHGSPDLQMTIKGGGFEPGATVSFGTVILTPSSISGTNQLTVTIPASLLTTVGSVSVTVNNPDGGGAGGIVSSAPVIFNITGLPVPPPPPPGPPSPPSPPSPPGGSPQPIGSSTATTTSIISVTNQYPGFVQLQTVTVAVTDGNGRAVTTGDVTFQDDGQTLVAPVVNGEASVTFATGFFDFGALIDLFFAHPLTVAYSDNGGPFAPSGAFDTVPAILLDFFIYELSLQLAPLNQLQQ